MNDEHFRFLSLMGQLPARLTAEQAASLLNCQPHDIPVLIAARLLKPLGNPQPNSVKFFAASDLKGHMNDRAWLTKATNAISNHWRQKNSRRAKPRDPLTENPP